jgi:transposase
MQYIAFDSHKQYTLARVETTENSKIREVRIGHKRGALRQFLADCEPGSPVAVETVGNWYWIVDEIEAAGCVPKLVHAHKATLMMGMINKTDKLDARGLNRLHRASTLPEVWIPRGELRDQRELPRTRMVFVQQRTQLKNRIQATVTKFGLTPPAVSDLFGQGGRLWLQQQRGGLPAQTAYTLAGLLDALETLSQQIDRLEQRMREVFHGTPAIDLLMTLPGVGFILAVVIAAEIGDVGRFDGPAYLASYAGTTPRVHASGGKTRYGPLRPDVNRYLKWAFVEAANVTCRVRRRHPHRHVSRLYERLARPKGHQKAVGAVARHLAEATSWMLTKQESYRDPHHQVHLDSSTEASARTGELSPSRLDILIATPLWNNFMPHRGRRNASGETSKKLKRQGSHFFLFSLLSGAFRDAPY